MLKIITKFEDIPRIAGEMGKIKGVKAVYLFGRSLYVVGEIDKKERIKIKGFATDKLDIFILNDLPIYTIFKILRMGKPLLVKDREFLNRMCFRISREYEDFRYILKRFIQEGYRIRNGIYVKVQK